MTTSLTIVRYPAWAIPFAFFAMMLHRFALYFNKKISFYKLMGSGKNGSFDKTPDLRQWAIMAVNAKVVPVQGSCGEITTQLYGKFISSWYKIFSCEVFHIFLEPVQSHGTWDAKSPFAYCNTSLEDDERMATLTRATIRLNKLKYFWQNVAPAATAMLTAPGFITSFGIGEIPWIKQATFSIWESKAAMQQFAYGSKVHAEIIKKTRAQKWYSEDMFVRFKILGSVGTLRGKNPLG